MVLALLASLRGSVCVYQGEELGLTEAEIPFDKLQDPYGITFWPEFKGRDGCRTPMPWRADAAFGGFSAAEPWLPVPPEHLAHAVDREARDPASVLEFYRHFLAWRRQHPVLRDGAIRFIDAPEPILAFERMLGAERYLAVFNFGETHRHWTLPAGMRAQTLDGHALPGAEYDEQSGRVELAPHGGWLGRLVE